MGSRGGKKRERLENSSGLLSVLSVCSGGGGVGGLGFERRRANILHSVLPGSHVRGKRKCKSSASDVYAYRKCKCKR